MPCENFFHLKKTNDEHARLRERSALKAGLLNKQCRGHRVNQYIRNLLVRDTFSQEISKANILPICPLPLFQEVFWMDGLL